MYDPVYSTNIGLCGFRCRIVNKDGSTCRKVVPTYRGIVMHCKRVHGLEAQMTLPGILEENKDGKEEPSGHAILKPIRAAERAVLIANGEGLPFAGRSED